MNLVNDLIFLMLSEIGVGLAGFGVSFLLLGVILLFDKGLLAIGNVRFKLLKIQTFRSNFFR